MYRLQVRSHFDAAHRLMNYDGKCSRLHGHRWDVEVCYQGEELDDTNILVDFVKVKSLLKDLLEGSLDHWYLNEMLLEPNPTAEFLAKWLFDRLIKTSFSDVKLVRTCIWESSDCCVKYSPTMKSVSE